MIPVADEGQMDRSFRRKAGNSENNALERWN